MNKFIFAPMLGVVSSDPSKREIVLQGIKKQNGEGGEV